MILPLSCDTADLIASTVDGNYTYVAYASDSSGTNYSTTYSSGTHTYGAVITSETEIENPSVSDFTGKWTPLQKQYTYYAFATDDSGTGFSTSYTGAESYVAIKNSDTEISSLSASNFTGLWFPLQKTYTYVAYADSSDGTKGYTTTYDSSKEYVAILVTNIEKTPVVGDFVGLWRKLTPQFKTFNEYVPTFFDTNKNAIHSTSSAPTRTFNPTCYYHNGTYKRFYFVYMEGAQPAGTSGATSTRRTVANGYSEEHYNRTWISYYDVESGSFGEPKEFTELYPRPADNSNPTEENAPHNLPIVIVADDGSVLVFKEDLDFTGAPSLHNSHIEVWKSNNIEDISSFTKVTAIGDGTTEYAFSYPNAWKLSDGTIIIMFRSKGGVGVNYGDGEERYIVAMKSEDNGNTWVNLNNLPTDPTVVCKLDNNGTGWRLYPVSGGEYNGINLALHTYDENYTGDPSKDVYFLHSDDGITWENGRQFVEGSGGYSVNILSSGEINGTSLDTNFRIDYLPDGDTLSLWAMSAGVDRNGIPYILGSKTDEVNNAYNSTINLYMYYYDSTTHAWITVDVLPNIIFTGNSDYNLVTKARGTIIPYENGIVDIYVTLMDKHNSDFESDTIISSGALIDGLLYKVVTTNGTIPYSVGEVFKSVNYTADANNTVIAIRSTPCRLRTDNHGNSFQLTKLPNSDYKSGGIGALGYNINCIKDEKLFLYYPVFETTLGSAVEYQNFLCWYSDLNR